MADVVPDRLFFSRLPGGELEFSCIAVLPTAPGGAAGSISWTLRAADNSARVLSCTRPLQDRELTKNRAVLSAVLPAEWPDSILTIDTGSATCVRQVRKYHQSQRFDLPFDSDVLVVGGHRIGEPHRVAFDLPSQQFGWDLLPLRLGNLALFNSDLSQPPKSQDLAAFGRPVLSPGNGVVIEVVDGRPDAGLLGAQQLPAGAEIGWAIGNHVIIRHDDDVYSCLAHLMAGSVTVTLGQDIGTRDSIGAVGSSGNVTGPHLHIHFMDGPDVKPRGHFPSSSPLRTRPSHP